jgi:DNA invertase Pin-like site-specific DNA recombinase
MTVGAAIYARTSPGCPMSADEQIEHLKTIAAERGWTVAQVFIEHPATAKRDRRPGEAALLHTIRSGAIDKVLVWSIDRIGRSLTDLVTFIEACRMAGVSLWLDAQGIDTTTSNGMSMFDVSMMMALHLRQSRRDRILRGQAAARAASIRFGRPPIARAKMVKAERELAAGKGVRRWLDWPASQPPRLVG